MTKDLNKGISNISYNLLNLPQQVDILSPLAEARNAYSYSADGVKLRVVKKYNSTYNASPIIGSAVNVSLMDVTKTTDYVGSKIFENNVLDRIFVDGGYIKGGIYYFYETDHLGDNRTVINQSGTVVERNDYYPFGMQMAHNQLTNSASGSDNKRKFGNKELDVMGGLNLYDSQARMQDPTLGRFTTVDPMSEKYYDISPYAYCGGNPLSRVDPDGRQFGISPFLLGSNNPFLPLGRVAMLSSSDKIINTARLNSGRRVETEQLQKLGLEKNTESITRIDPKTNKEGTTIPDALKNGQTYEVKNVQKQSLTKQLRLQEKISNENGKNPILHINKDATLSKPLKNSSFEISTYSSAPVAAQDNTKVMKPVVRDMNKPGTEPVKSDWQPIWKIQNKI